MIRSSLLLGSNYETLGDVAIEEITPQLAIGISRGRFRKGYPHVDPNEDAVIVAADDATTVLAVADGHNGFDAAGAAILAIADTSPLVIGSEPESIVRELATAAVKSVGRTVPDLDPPRDASRTALTICVIRDGSLTTATLGDTVCFVATKRRVKRVGEKSLFLSPTSDPNALQVESDTLKSGSIVVVASDGFADFTHPLDRTIRAAAKQASHKAVDTLISAAFAGGAGDNVAVAVAQIEE